MTPPVYCPTGTIGAPDAKPGNCLYDTGFGETVQSYTFNRGFTVTQLCGRASGVVHCNSGGTVNDLIGIDIAFVRPNTTSIVTGLRSGPSLQLDDAQIKISSPTGNGIRYVCLTRAGEVSVAATACP